MAYISKPTASMMVWNTTNGTLVDTAGPLEANKWYTINTTASTGSGLPSGFRPGNVFRTAGTSPATLVEGDSVYPILAANGEAITLNNAMCRTDAEITYEEGTTDVTDSCSGGYNSKILDGYVNINGSLSGFLKYNEVTGEVEDSTNQILNRFLDEATDDGAGQYTVKSRDNKRLLMAVLTNKDANKVGNVQTWIFLYINILSMGTGGGLKDAQKRDLSWEKAEGQATKYLRTVTAGDIQL